MTTPTKTTDLRPISVQISHPLPGDRWTDLEDLAADPAIVERYGRQRKEKETSRLLSILDQLERGKA
jgi:hypothetical protein